MPQECQKEKIKEMVKKNIKKDNIIHIKDINPLIEIVLPLWDFKQFIINCWKYEAPKFLIVPWSRPVY